LNAYAPAIHEGAGPRRARSCSRSSALRVRALARTAGRPPVHSISFICRIIAVFLLAAQGRANERAVRIHARRDKNPPYNPPYGMPLGNSLAGHPKTRASAEYRGVTATPVSPYSVFGKRRSVDARETRQAIERPWNGTWKPSWFSRFDILHV